MHILTLVYQKYQWTKLIPRTNTRNDEPSWNIILNIILEYCSFLHGRQKEETSIQFHITNYCKYWSFWVEGERRVNFWQSNMHWIHSLSIVCSQYSQTSAKSIVLNLGPKTSVNIYRFQLTSIVLSRYPLTLVYRLVSS